MSLSLHLVNYVFCLYWPVLFLMTNIKKDIYALYDCVKSDVWKLFFFMLKKEFLLVAHVLHLNHGFKIF